MSKNNRDKIVPVRFTELEYRTIQNLASFKGVPISTFLRMVAISEVREFNQSESNKMNANSIKFKPSIPEIKEKWSEKNGC